MPPGRCDRERGRENTHSSKKETTCKASKSQLFLLGSYLSFLGTEMVSQPIKAPRAGFPALFEYQHHGTHLNNYRTEQGHSKIKDGCLLFRISSCLSDGNR